MTIDYDSLSRVRIPDVEQSYTVKDSILYALGCGLGLDPGDTDQLPFVYEADVRALPTMATVLAHPGFWIRDLDTGIDWVRVVQGGQAIRLSKPLPAQGTVVGVTRVDDIVDKGPGRGASVLWSRKLYDKTNGDELATVEQVSFCRGDGGFSGPARVQPPAHRLPDRAPDLACMLPTSPQAALIYRLSGDLNPLHADPEVARAAGFSGPILHGLATFGVAGHALLKSVANNAPEALRSMSARFTSPVYPGETLLTEMWADPDHVSFRVTAAERQTVAIDNGFAELEESKTVSGNAMALERKNSARLHA